MFSFQIMQLFEKLVCKYSTSCVNYIKVRKSLTKSSSNRTIIT